MTITWDTYQPKYGKPVGARDVDTSPRQLVAEGGFSVNFNERLDSSEAEVPSVSEDVDDVSAAKRALAEPGDRTAIDDLRREIQPDPLPKR